jgi:hypothetical protein
VEISEPFDPYLKWLGIRSAQRPPDHYRLLGLELFESDSDVIAAAADRQMAHVRRFQNGPHAVHSQDLLNQLAAAKVCLLRVDMKAAYDEQLRLYNLTPISEDLRSSSHRREVPAVKPRSVRGRLPWVLGATTLAFVILIGAFFVRGMQPRSPESQSAEVPVSAPTSSDIGDGDVEPDGAAAVKSDGPNTVESVPLDVPPVEASLAGNSSDRRNLLELASQEGPQDAKVNGPPSELTPSADIDLESPRPVAVDEPDSRPGAAGPAAFRGLPLQEKRANIEHYRRTGERPRERNGQIEKEPPRKKPKTRHRTGDREANSRMFRTDNYVWLVAQQENKATGPSSTYQRLMQAMRDRDLPAAWRFVEELEKNASSYDQRDAADRLRMLWFLLERFWVAVDDGASRLIPGMKMGEANEVYTIMEVQAGKLTIQNGGDQSTKKEVAIERRSIPLGLAVQLAIRDLGRRGANAKGPLAACLAVDREGNRNQAAEIARDLRRNGGYFPIDLQPSAP